MLRKSGLKLVFLLAAAAALCAQAEPPGAAFNRIGGEARAAREARDYPVYLARIRELLALTPGHSAMHYSLARGLSLAYWVRSVASTRLHLHESTTFQSCTLRRTY